MPDLFSQGGAAFNQALLLLISGFCIGLGALLIGHEIYVRRRGIRVTGSIIGVRETKPGMYFNVYRYTLPNGETIEDATSTSGSNLSRGRDTGLRVELFTLPGAPESVSEARSPVAAMFGVGVILIGMVPAWFALTVWPVTRLTGVMLLAVLGLVVARVAARIIPARERKSPQDWQQAKRAERQARLAALPVRRIEDILRERAG